MNSYKQDLKQLKDKIKNMIMWKMKTDTENILKDLFRITDHYLPLSQQGRFSEYDNAKEQLQEQINDLLYIAEEEETVKNRLETIRGDIQKVKELLEDITEIGDDGDTDEEGNYIVSKLVLDDVNKDIDKAVTMLGKIEDKCDI